MSYMLDTDRLAAFLKGRSDAQALVANSLSEGVFINLITYGEIYEGIYYGRDPRSQEQAFLTFLDGTNVLPLNEQIMKRFARIRGELRSKGLIIADSDLMIAATAIEHDLTLVTGNKKHFERIPGLTLL